MPVTYGELLDATIQHLEALKSRGARHVAVSAETLRQLSKPAASSTIREPAEPPKGFGARARGEPAPGALESAPSAEKRQETAAVQNASVPLGIQSEIRNPKSVPEKATAFAALRERVIVCVKCANLASSRKNVVFGVGNIDAQLMFVGEAPGADEDVQGEPFVGRAGELLTRIIQAMGLQRSDVYIANVLKCRPDTPGQTAGNRKPTPDEMATCVPYLHEQIDLIQPRVLVALGATAIEGLLGKTLGIMKLRGNWKTYRGTPLMPTFHPAYLLRNQAMTEKRKVWEDMLAVMEKLEMPISDKQRKFFTRG
jgi:uracil-DNA glycosylase family 4